MAAAFRTVAICVGLLNVGVIGLAGDSPYLGYTDLASSPTALGMAALCAAAAGLVASEIVLRLMRPALQGGFSLRYGILVLTMCLGGAIFGVLITVGASLGASSGGDYYVGLAMSGAVGALFGGQMGFLEGLVFAFPLAAILGRFRTAD